MSGRRRNGPQPPPGWRVRIAAHAIDRYAIPEQTLTVCAHGEHDARLAAVRASHRRASLPPWRPYVRESMAFATVLEGAA
jgi:hypothetical protein